MEVSFENYDNDVAIEVGQRGIAMKLDCHALDNTGITLSFACPLFPLLPDSTAFHWCDVRKAF